MYSRYVSNFQPESRGVLSDAQVSRWGKAYEYYLRNWLPSGKNASIVDLACGGGRLLHFFKRLGYTRISGVDISPEQVALAKTVTKAVYEEDILAYLSSRPETFDLITGIDIIEHLTKEEGLRFLKQCYQALKPGGRLILQTPNADSPWFSSIFHSDVTHEVGYTPHSLHGMLKQVGFELAETRETGPIPLNFGVKTGIRFLLWHLLRIAIMTWNIIEIGTTGSRVFTRVFLISARK